MSSAGNDAARVPVVVPDLKAGSAPIRVVQWLVDAGTHVLAGDRVVELLTNGVVFHVESPAEGVLETARAGRAEVHAGEVLGWVDAQSESDSPAGDAGREPL